MSFRLLSGFLLSACIHASAQDLSVSLDRVAETATAMVDGDLCLRIQTKRSLYYLQFKDERDLWRAGDNYDVDHSAFLQTKKTLVRLSHLCAAPCDVNLWIPVPAHPENIQIVVRNVLEMSQFWKWGDLQQTTPPEMRDVLSNGKRLMVKRLPGMVSVLAAVYDSLGDVVALAEVVSREKQDPRENVK